MPVSGLQIVADLHHDLVGNDCTLLTMSLDLNIGEPGTWIRGQITTLQQVAAEATKPAQIIVSGYKGVVSLDVDIV